MSEAQRLFEELNRRYFRGRLPRYRVRFVTRHRIHAEGIWYGECDSETRVIRLRHGLTDSSTPTLRQALLHEMCHIGAPRRSPRWQAKMKRLALMSESWAQQEAAEYAEELRTLRPWPARVKDTLEELSMLQEELTWPTALRLLARSLGRRSSDVLRAAPWAPRTWKRLMAERRAFDQAREALRQRLRPSPKGAACLSPIAEIQGTVLTVPNRRLDSENRSTLRCGRGGSLAH